MLPRALLTLIASIVWLASLASGDVYLTEEQALKLAFPQAERVEKQLLALTADERAAIEKKLGVKDAPRVFKYWVGRRGDEILGYAVIDDALGKDQPITYMVSVDEKLVVRSVEILAYRESRGGEVRQADWREQFRGTSSESRLRVGSDIRNIAGATISCRSLTEGVRRQLSCLSVLVKPRARPSGGELARGTLRGSPDTAKPKLGSTAGVETISADTTRASQAVLVSRKQLLMGTTFEIRVYAENAELGQAGLGPAFAEVARLEDILSTWRADSEVSQLNRAAGGEVRAASPELLELCTLSIQTSEHTLGAFDVTVGPLVDLWKAAVHAGTSPTAEDLETARHRTGYSGIEIDREHGKLRLAREGMALDFGGIGKGYALDRAARKLEEHGIHSALLDFGGQLLALAPPPDEMAWSAEVRDPSHPERALTRIRLAHASISSTADYERGMTLGARHISHIVDPRSGQPVEGMLGTSVITSTAVEADGLSTALYVLGFEAAVHFAEEHGVAALLVAADGRIARTKGFQSRELMEEKFR